MTVLADQITRTQSHDQRTDLRLYVGNPRDTYSDMSVFFAGSNVATGGATEWVDVTSQIGGTITLDSGEHGAKLNLHGWRFSDDSFDAGLRRRILLKARYGGGGTDSGWQDIFVGYLGQGGDVTGIWQSSQFGETAEGEGAWLGRTLLPAHHFGPTNLALGKSASASSVLTVPDSEYPLERFSGGAVGPEKAVDGVVFDTLWIAQNAPQLNNDYYSPVFGKYYRINEVAGHMTGANDTLDYGYAEIIACYSVNWDSTGTRNLGNIQAWDSTYMPGGTPGLVGWHQNGANYSLHAPDIAIPFAYSGTNQILRNTRTGNIIAGMKYIMTTTNGTWIPTPGWNCHAKLIYYAPLPNDGNKHYIKWRTMGDGTWQYVQLTGGWQTLDVESDAATNNNGADAYWELEMYAWTTSDTSGVADTSIAYMDFARLQIVQGAPITGAYDAQMTANWPPRVFGLGTLRLKVRDHTGLLIQDVDLSRYPTTKTKGLQSIIVTPCRQALDATFANLGATNSIIVDTNDLYPGIWFDTSAASTTTTGAVSSGLVNIPVASTTGFASAGAIIIDSEIITYTSTDATHFLSCTRHADNTAAASHSNGATVTVPNLVLYSAAYVDPQNPGTTLVNAVTHDVVTLNSSTQPPNTNYASYSAAYPVAPYAYQRNAGISGAFAQNIYPSPGVPTMGSTREVIMVDLGAYVYATLTIAIGTSDTLLEVSGDGTRIPLNGYVKVDSEYMKVTAMAGSTITVTRNATVPSVPPVTGTLAVHSAGATLIPMLPDALPATTWHPQVNPRVAAVALARKDGMSPIVDCSVLYSTTTAALPTDEYSSGWTSGSGGGLFRRVSANSASQIVLLAPGNNGTPPAFPPAGGFFDDPSLVGIEARRIAVIINHMGIRPDGTGVNDRAKLNELIVYEKPANAGISGNYLDTSTSNLREIFGHLWCQDYGGNISHPPAEMNARYHPSQSFAFIGMPINDLNLTQSTYASIIQQLCDSSGLDWWVDEWCNFVVSFHRHSGLGLPPGTQPVIDFNRSFVRQINPKALTQLQTAQVKLTGTDYTGRSYTAVWPPAPAKTGKITTATINGVISQAALNRMAKARYNMENRRWDVTITLGICEYLLLQRGGLVTLTWLIGNGTEVFQGKVFVIASWQQTFINKESAWEVTTTVKLEEKMLI